MNIDRRGLSLILTGVAFIVFLMFIILAGYFHPDAETAGIENAEARAIAESMAQMTWWMSVALVTLPVLMLLILIAVYLFMTQDKQGFISKTQEKFKSSLFGGHAQPMKVLEPSNATDLLDLRYARGEISQDQYMAMKNNMKAGRV
jgi:uncharacterized membrane protein